MYVRTVEASNLLYMFSTFDIIHVAHSCHLSVQECILCENSLRDHTNHFTTSATFRVQFLCVIKSSKVETL